MDNTVKQRVIGAVVLVALAVIFVPMLLEQPDQDLGQVGGSLPDQPEQTLQDRIEPLTLPEPPPETEPAQVVLDQPAAMGETAAGAAAPVTEVAPSAPVTEGVQVAPLAEAPSAPASAPVAVAPAPAVVAPAPAPAPIAATPAATPMVEAPKPTPAPVAATPAPVAKPAAAPAKAPSSWVVQLASLASKPNAMALQERLRGLGFTAYVEEIKSAQGVLYRVRVGPELLRANAETLRNRLEQQVQIKGIVTSYP